MFEYLAIASDTLRGCGFIRGGMALLEEMCHCGGGLWGLICSSYAQCGTQSLSAAFVSAKI